MIHVLIILHMDIMILIIHLTAMVIIIILTIILITRHTGRIWHGMS